MANTPIERNSRKIMARLSKEGWRVVNIEGSHHKLAHPAHKHKIVLVHPKKDLPIGKADPQGGGLALGKSQR